MKSLFMWETISTRNTTKTEATTPIYISVGDSTVTILGTIHGMIRGITAVGIHHGIIVVGTILGIIIMEVGTAHGITAAGIRHGTMVDGMIRGIMDIVTVEDTITATMMDIIQD